MHIDVFRSDVKTIDAAEILCPGPDWPGIRGLGNWLRHQYGVLDLGTIRNAATVDAPALGRAVQTALEKFGADPASGSEERV